MHDPAWWWVAASNRRGPGGPAVRFSLAHVMTASKCVIDFSMNVLHPGQNGPLQNT